MVSSKGGWCHKRWVVSYRVGGVTKGGWCHQGQVMSSECNKMV